MQTYHRYRQSEVSEGALIIKFYHSGDQIRGYIRKIADEGQDDSIFPGEEMEPRMPFAWPRTRTVTPAADRYSSSFRKASNGIPPGAS